MATFSVKIIDKLGDNTRGLLRVVKYPSGKVRVSGIELNQKFIEDTPEKTKETLVHEIQHAVQEYENFARGGSLEGAGGFNNYYRPGGEQEARETAERARSYTESKHRIDELSRQLDLKKKVSPACAGMIPDGAINYDWYLKNIRENRLRYVNRKKPIDFWNLPESNSP